MRGIEQLQEGATQVRVRLHPPQLGSLQMSLRIEQSQMQLELVVESAAARDAVRNRMQELEGRLAEQGLELQKVEIKVAGQQTAGNGQETPNGSPQHHWDSPDRGSERPQAPARHSDDNPLSTELTPLSRPLLSNQPALSIDIRA
jgi:flagellar hook-length control protein FliK